jgi:hypothetical protein
MERTMTVRFRGDAPATAVWGLVLCAACGPGVGEGPIPSPASVDGSVDATEEAGPDALVESGLAGPSDAGPGDAGVNPSDGGDAEPPSYRCPENRANESVIIAASDIGAGIRLVALGQSTLLAAEERAGITEPLLLFLDDDMYERGRARLPAPPSSSLHPVGVINRRQAPFGENWPFPHHAIVLARGESGNALYGANLSPGATSDLVPMTGVLISPSAELRGLTYLRDKITGIPEEERDVPIFLRACVFGDGITCFSHDGVGWETDTLARSDGGPVFNSLAMTQRQQEWMVAAAGEGGRLALVPLEGAGVTEELPSGTERDLLTVAASGARLAAAGAEGTVVYRHLPLPEPTTCNLFDESVVTLKFWEDELRGVTADGLAFHLPFAGCEACRFDVELGPVLGGRLTGLDGDFLLLKQDALVRVHADVDPIVIE